MAVFIPLSLNHFDQRDRLLTNFLFPSVVGIESA
jgi:hypothetical protein